MNLIIASPLLRYPLHWDQIVAVCRELTPKDVTLVELPRVSIASVHAAHGISGLPLNLLAGRASYKSFEELSFFDQIYSLLRIIDSDSDAVIWYIGEPTDRQFLSIAAVTALLPVRRVVTGLCENEFHSRMRTGSRLKQTARKLLALLAISRIDGFIANSRSAVESLSRIVPLLHLRAVAPIGFSRDMLLPIPRNENHRPGGARFLFVGRLVEEKGVFEILNAFGTLGQPSTLRFVGEGGAQPALEELARALNVGEQISFAGIVGVESLRAELAAADVLVCFSKGIHGWREQFGLAVVEAFSAGVAVISSDSGALPEVVGDAGILVPEGSTRELALAMARLRDDVVKRSSLCRLGRLRYEGSFSLTAVSRAIAGYLKMDYEVGVI